MATINFLKEPIGVLMLANRLSAERYNGTPLRNLDPVCQQFILADAKSMLEHYKERHS